MNNIQVLIGIVLIIVLLGGLWGLTRTLKECERDEDCIPENPLLGARYLCENGVCTTKPFGNPMYCQSDTDCVPATCCHPDSCINNDYRPDCSAVSCTMECKPDTIDCGQGKCVCVDNSCQVEWA